MYWNNLKILSISQDNNSKLFSKENKLELSELFIQMC